MRLLFNKSKFIPFINSACVLRATTTPLLGLHFVFSQPQLNNKQKMLSISLDNNNLIIPQNLSLIGWVEGEENKKMNSF